MKKNILMAAAVLAVSLCGAVRAEDGALAVLAEEAGAEVSVSVPEPGRAQAVWTGAPLFKDKEASRPVTGAGRLSAAGYEEKTEAEARLNTWLEALRAAGIEPLSWKVTKSRKEGWGFSLNYGDAVMVTAIAGPLRNNEPEVRSDVPRLTRLLAGRGRPVASVIARSPEGVLQAWVYYCYGN